MPFIMVSRLWPMGQMHPQPVFENSFVGTQAPLRLCAVYGYFVLQWQSAE